MRKKLELIMAVTVIVGAYFFAREGARMAESKKAEEGKICIVIDAGHGGSSLRNCCHARHLLQKN